MDTMVAGQAAAAAPHLPADLDALVGTKPGVTQPQGAGSSAAASPGTASPGTVGPGTVNPGRHDGPHAVRGRGSGHALIACGQDRAVDGRSPG